jgi:hypothetical protein
MKVAFDVDDTLLIPPEGQESNSGRDVPNYETIAIYNWFKRQGNYMIIWSGGGADYARMWGEKLGLNPDEYRAKQADMGIDIAFDDCDVLLAKCNVKVKRFNNSIKRTLPNDRINAPSAQTQ